MFPLVCVLVILFYICESFLDTVDFTKESPPIHFLCNGDETQKSWKPLLNMISALRGSSEWFAQWNWRTFFCKIDHTTFI